ncbi:hypothetical protein AUL39_07375 [Tractidigestivibacter scatoligenes]|uniref:DUF3825 domain-containing protein n=1 Tax=Tractidigestivibacter scatoligenes TaxID=1299998 RepID=A0A124EGN5_TRASO|nr:DUF3825 domain-containing protein [Tractidigestivibacter scatoligenes]KUH58034.1 hypothetical protein AUL39_07375 [Tractidigestivibacter scatoligenes]
MPRITPGNRLYLYKLLSSTLGTNRQALLSRVEEVLLEDGIAPQDLGQEDIQSLMEALPEFVRLTVFKKGRVYATIVPNEEYDGYLERAGQSGSDSAGEKGSKSKPWKRRKGSHDPKPTKPRHVEKAEAKPEPAPEPEAAAEPEPASAPEPGPETVTVPEPEPVPAPAPAPQPSPADETPKEPNGPQVEATGAETREQPAPETPASSGINLTITYDPYEDMEADLAAAAQAQPTAPTPAAAPAPVAPAPTPVSAPAPAAAPTPAPNSQQLPHQNLPERFSEEVHCKDELLRVLYQKLPIDADVTRTLDEDWRVARSTGTLSGTRSRVTFPLRYLHEDGSGPVEVTIRRTSRPTSGKQWSLALVDGDDGTGAVHEQVGLEGLPAADEGAWSDLAGAPQQDTGSPAVSPLREFAQFAVIGSWERTLGTLATMATPERWNFPGEGVGGPSRYGILREYLTVTFHRAVEQGRIATATDSSLAAYNTGLLTPFGEDVYAVFSPNFGDIPWKLDGFATAGSGELGARLVATLPELPQPASYLERVEDVVCQPGHMLILDTEALLGEKVGRLPRAFLADQLAGSPEASRLLRDGMDAGNGRLGRSACRELARTIKGDPSLYRRMGRALQDATTLSLRLAQASYRMAAPAFDPATSTMRLLLPLCLVDDGVADCAMSLELMPSGAYRGAAILSLPRAYACARVVSRDQPTWLSPEIVL